MDGKRGMKRNAGHAEVFWDFGHPSSPQNPKRVRSVSRLLHLQRHPAMDWTAPDMSELFDSTESSLPRLHHPRSARLRLPLPLEERKKPARSHRSFLFPPKHRAAGHRNTGTPLPLPRVPHSRDTASVTPRPRKKPQTFPIRPIPSRLLPLFFQRFSVSASQLLPLHVPISWDTI